MAKIQVVLLLVMVFLGYGCMSNLRTGPEVGTAPLCGVEVRDDRADPDFLYLAGSAFSASIRKHLDPPLATSVALNLCSRLNKPLPTGHKVSVRIKDLRVERAENLATNDVKVTIMAVTLMELPGKAPVERIMSQGASGSGGAPLLVVQELIPRVISKLSAEFIDTYFGLAGNS